MSQFEVAAAVENLIWTWKLADYPRATNRALINSLFNGTAPYSEQEAQENNLQVNFNDLTAPRQAHDARRQFSGAFQKPANFFKVGIDTGPVHKRGERSSIITKEINKLMKKSLPYFETLRSTFANVVLHGIGPSTWQDKERWYCKAKGVEDVLVPSNTTLDLDNLSMFAVFESYTAMQLRKLTMGPNVDPAWNMPLVNKLIKQAEEQILDFGIPYSELYSPEKQVERIKMDSGFYAADSLSTIDTWSFYFWNDEGESSGWNKRIILDANYTYGGVGGVGTYPTTRRQVGELKTNADTRDEFLYNPGKRKYADKINELIHFQFGDLSAVAPFRYHSVRSLGFLLYAVCHLQNRFRCKFMDSAFEQMMQYFRVKSLEDVERVLKINLIDKGYIDETVQFVPPNERWQMPQAIAELALGDMEKLIGQNASIYKGDNEYGRTKEKTATEVMAEVNAATALVGAALQQSYCYQNFQYEEIARRFTIKNSKDKDVREFRLRCLKQGVPESLLNDPNCWDISAERVVGSGNKTQEMAIANQLLQMRPMYDPEPQREILQIATLAFTDDPALTNRLVPENQNKVSDSKVNAQRSAASLLMGLKVDVQTGENHIEIVEAMLHEMTIYIQGLEASGGMATQKEIMGLQNMAQYIGQQIQIIAQDPAEKQRVKAYSDDLGKLMNLVKAYAQRLQQQMQKAAQQNGNGGLDPKDASKIQANIITAQAKAANTRESHAQRTAQRQTQFELEQQRKTEQHAQDISFEQQLNALDLQRKAIEDQMDLQKQHADNTMELTHEVRKGRVKANAEESND